MIRSPLEASQEEYSFTGPANFSIQSEEDSLEAIDPTTLELYKHEMLWFIRRAIFYFFAMVFFSGSVLAKEVGGVKGHIPIYAASCFVLLFFVEGFPESFSLFKKMKELSLSKIYSVTRCLSELIERFFYILFIGCILYTKSTLKPSPFYYSYSLLPIVASIIFNIFFLILGSARDECKTFLKMVRLSFSFLESWDFLCFG